ncbi:MAG: DUF3237 domain-containing protein [Steroidobacteraceae bacterium]
MKPDLELAFEARATLAPPLVVGATPEGMRRVIPITGGVFSGPALRGAVLAGGADWQFLRSDGVTVLEAQYLLRTDDDVLIQVTNRGLRHGPEEIMRRLAAGEEVDPAAYYFRAAPSFSAPAGQYEWLNRSLFLCTGVRHASAVSLWMWRVC